MQKGVNNNFFFIKNLRVINRKLYFNQRLDKLVPNKKLKLDYFPQTLREFSDLRQALNCPSFLRLVTPECGLL